MAESWKSLYRPGYFGRRKHQIINRLNITHGIGNWRLVWTSGRITVEFASVCTLFYERSYYDWLTSRPTEIDYICSFGECIDNAFTNVNSGCDYSSQESFSTHIQDIAVRNVLRRIGREFQGPKDRILEIRSTSSNGYRFSPGRIPYSHPDEITLPSLAPGWARHGSVEDFWQSNKWVQVREPHAP